ARRDSLSAAARRHAMRALGLLLGTAVLGVAQPADDSFEALAAGFKPLLAKALPEVLFEQSTNWGHQEPAANGLRWHGLRAEVVKTPKNDGKWRKVRLTTQDLPRTLVINISDFKAIDDQRQTFKVFL